MCIPDLFQASGFSFFGTYLANQLSFSQPDTMSQLTASFRAPAIFSVKIILRLVILNMLTKKQVLSMVKHMPDTFDMVHLFDHILLINKPEEGRKRRKNLKNGCNS